MFIVVINAITSFTAYCLMHRERMAGAQCQELSLILATIYQSPRTCRRKHATDVTLILQHPKRTVVDV